MFELRARQNALNAVGLTGDYGLLHAIDERLASYGFETNTGVKFVVVVDMRGRRIDQAVAAGLVQGGGGRTGNAALAAGAVGLREGEMRTVSILHSFRGRGVLEGMGSADDMQVFKAMQTAYVKLLQNPFFDPDEHSPPGGSGGKKITSKKFAEDMRRIGESWTPGVTTL